MAVSHRLALFYLNSPSHIISIRAKPLPLAATPTVSLSRPTTRKNYLRQKILKTLTKPYPFSVDPLLPTISQENLRLNDEFELPSDKISVAICPVTSGEVVKPEELTGWETSESSANFSGTVPEGSVLRFGAYLIGVFVVQTVVAVWMMGNPNSDRKINSEGAEEMSRREFPVKRIGKVFPGNFDTRTDNFVSIDESEFEEKVEEIRAMAGAVREAEKRQASEGVDIADGNVISPPRFGIGKEIDARLKLQKRKTSSVEKIPDSRVNFLNKIREVEDGVGKDDSDEKEKKETLMFKKRYKFRSSSRELETSPKGFQGEVSNISKRKKKDSSSIDQAVVNGNIVGDSLKMSKQANKGVAKAQDIASGIFGEEDGTNLTLQESLFPSDDDDAKKLDRTPERSSEPSNGDISTVKALSSKTRELRTNPKGIMKGIPRTSKTSRKAAKPILSGNGAGDKSVVPMVREKHSSTATSRWWLILPYVLELYESVESNKMNIVVVKKGQIQLYVGQPFADVEMALQALVEQERNSGFDSR